MIVNTNGIIEKDKFPDELYGEESCTSSEPCSDYQLICPSLRSYSSLDLLSCSYVDEEECRMVKLNNTIKKLVDLIDDPIKREDVKSVCCLLCKFFRYNGIDGYYVKHLPQIGEILEFLAMRAKRVDEYLHFLCQFLKLCDEPLLLQRSSEILTSGSRLQRHFSLLGYLLALAPTRSGFLLTKSAIERLAAREDAKTERRRDAVKPDARREALEASRLPVTLAELAEVASDETYPAILEMILRIASASHACCFRILEVGIEKLLLLRMHPEYECNFECLPVTEDTDLQLDKEDYYKSLEYSTKILSRLMTSIILSNELPESIRNLLPPTQQAMWSLRAAFRRDVLRSGGSSRSRRSRNELASLILSNLVARRGWELVESGLAEDLAILGVATEGGARNTWAANAVVSGPEGLTFKKTLLLILALLVQMHPDVVQVLKNKKIISGLLRLVNPNFEAAKTTWNSEQLCHLFKYASNALTYLAPKIPDEFIEDNGSLRLFLLLERFKQINDARTICFMETICSLTSGNCDSILNNFRERESIRKQEFIPILLQTVYSSRILQSHALTINRQKIITLLLVACENIMENQRCLLERSCNFVVKTAIELLRRCLHPKKEDSELEQSFLVAIGSFIWKCLVGCLISLRIFLKEGGLYLILDHMEVVNLPVQNLYLGLLIDMCENENCSHYLLSWRCRDKEKGLMSLLVNIWREEERIFNVMRTRDGCIADVESPIINDEQWFYIFFTKSDCHASNLTTTTLGPARPKIYYLRKILMPQAEKFQNDYYKTLFQELPIEDQITILAIDAYNELKEDEATVEITKLLDIRPLTKSRMTLNEKKPIGVQGARIRALQGKLLELRRAEEIQAEREAFRAIRESKRSPAFDAIEELTYVARTSLRDCMLAKTTEMRQKCELALEAIERRDGPFYRTYNVDANVTNVFNQRLKIQSTLKPCEELQEDDLSMVSSTTPIFSPCESSCSLATYNSESSFLLKAYKFNSNGNLELIS